MDKEELIPIERVLDDMYSEKSIVALSARDYYYVHYATNNEKRSMDREDKVVTIIGWFLFSLIPIGIIVTLLLQM